MSDFIEIQFLDGNLTVMPKRAIRLCAQINSGYYVYDADDKLYSEDPDFHKVRAVSHQEYMRICATLKCLTIKSFPKSRLVPDDPDSEFAGPDRSYPVNDRSHAANAEARASQMENEGKLSPAEKAKIDAKANKVLGKKKRKTKND